MRAIDVRVGVDRRRRLRKAGKLIPVPMVWIVAGRLPIIEKRNDMSVVSLVNAGHTPAAKQLALETAKDPHGSCLDTAIAVQV